MSTLIEFPAKAAEFATYRGEQEDGQGGSFTLVNLTRDIPGHPKHSTIALATLMAAIGEPEEAK